MKKQILSEEFKRFQKLAGIITENKINEEYNEFLDTEEGGFMREYIDDVADEENLDLDYRGDFDIAFNLALSKLSQEQSPLYISDDSKLAPEFITPKGIGFVMNNNEGTITPKIVQIFNDNYGIIDINYIRDFFTNTNNWKMITDENDIPNYKKLYLIDIKNNKIGNKESFF